MVRSAVAHRTPSPRAGHGHDDIGGLKGIGSLNISTQDGAEVSVWFAEAGALLRSAGGDCRISDHERLRIAATHPGRRMLRQASYVLRRMALARLVGCGWEACGFAEEPGGRPTIAYPVEARVLSFSLARTKGMVAVGFGRGTAVGLDIEHTGYDRQRLAFVANTFGASELPLLDSPMGREEATIAVWTVKEAIGKAQGIGVGALPHCHGLALVADGIHRQVGSHDSNIAVPPLGLSLHKPRPGFWLSIATVADSASTGPTSDACMT